MKIGVVDYYDLISFGGVAMRKTVINENGEQLVVMDRSDRGPLTEEERQMIAAMDDFEDELDEDCPAMPEAMAEQMRQDIAQRRALSRAAN